METKSPQDSYFKQILDNLLEGCAIIGFDWHFLYINDAAAQQARLEKSKLLGRKMMEVFPGIEEAPGFDLLVRCMETREAQKFENKFVYPDGSNAWFDLRLQPVPEGVCLMSLDITQHKKSAERFQELQQAEAALLESDRRIRLKLESILSPEGDIGNLELADIIDVPAVQSLLDDFYQLTHFPVSILDLPGKLLAGAGWQEICTKFHRVHPETCQHCLKSDTQLSEGVPPGEFRLYKCKNHMWDIATPIMVGGKKLGNLFSGQFFFEGEPLAYDLFRSQARKYGFNEAEYIAALERVPRLTGKTVEAGMAFLVKLAQTLSLLSYSNIKLARSLAERDALMDSIRDSEEALRQAHETLRLTLDAAPVAIFDLDTEGRIKNLWNAAAEQMLGWRRDEVLGQFLPSVPKESKEEFAGFRAWVRSGKPIMGRDVLRRRKDGSLIEYSIYAAPEYDDDGKVIGNIAVLMDITARKRMEEALRQSEQKFRLLYDEAPLGYQSLDEDGLIIEVNQTWLEILGYARDEVIGRWFGDFLAPDYVDHFLKNFPCFKEAGAICDVQFDMVRRDGANIRVSFNGKIAYDAQGQFLQTHCMFQDITARKEAEDALRDNEQFLTDIFNSIQDGLSIVDPELNILRVNPAMEKFGYTQQLVGKKCYEVYHGRREPCEVCPSRQTLLTGKASREIVTEHLADGSDRFMEIHAFPLLNRTSGQVQSVIEFVRDVTERLRTEAERLRFSKLESVSTLAGGIAHDFNNILTAILGNISLARLELPEGHREILAEAETACLQAQKLAKQLLTFAKGGTPVKKLLSVEKLVTESVSFSCRGSNVKSDFTFPDDLWPVEADPGQIGQVFQNLLINAIQAMPNGGTINIWGENLAVQPREDLPLSPGKYVRISLQDQGIGIPEESLPKIFDPYFTTKQTGSGLGLATAYSIVKNHHGYLSVASKLGIGTTFQVYLPASDRPLVTTSAVAAGKLHAGKGKILVMDDEELVRQVLGTMLSRLGYEVALAQDGAEAIEIFAAAQASGDHFVAAIMDLTIPGGMGGKEAITNLLEIDPHLKGIVSSGYSDDPIMADFSKYGFRGVIHKPYKITELSEVLHHLVNQMT